MVSDCFWHIGLPEMGEADPISIITLLTFGFLVYI